MSDKKIILPKEVADELEKAKLNDLNFYGYLKHSVDGDFKATWNFTFFVGDTNSKIALLLDAWTSGYTVEVEE